MNRKTFSLIPVLAFVLSACGGEPSGSDLRQALQKLFDSVTQGVPGMPVAKVKNLEKHGCEPTPQDSAWLCDVTSTVDPPFGAETTSTVRLRVIKTGDGYAISGGAP